MAPKLIPLTLLSTGENTFSFMSRAKRPTCSAQLTESIVKDGLLNPLVVMQQGKKFIVIDGKKRLAAIRQLTKSKRLAKAIAKVPCIIQDTLSLKPIESRRPLLLSGPELAHKIITADQNLASHASIAQRFECELDVVEDCLSIRRLHPELLRHFNNNAISLEQAAAFATIENVKAQLDLLHQLGPFVSNTEIISAIRAGATVVTLSDDSIIFLPSRRRPVAAAKQKTFEFDKRKPLNAPRNERLAA